MNECATADALGLHDLRQAFDHAGRPSAASASTPEVARHESPLLSVEEAAEYLKRPASWIYRTLRYQIPIVKLGQHVYFEKREIDAYIANCREVPGR